MTKLASIYKKRKLLCRESSCQRSIWWTYFHYTANYLFHLSNIKNLYLISLKHLAEIEITKDDYLLNRWYLLPLFMDIFFLKLIFFSIMKMGGANLFSIWKRKVSRHICVHRYLGTERLVVPNKAWKPFNTKCTDLLACTQMMWWEPINHRSSLCPLNRSPMRPSLAMHGSNKVGIVGGACIMKMGGNQPFLYLKEKSFPPCLCTSVLRYIKVGSSK